MSEKILNEFAVRLNKSRTQLTDVCSQVDILRKEATSLQKQLESVQQEKKTAERVQSTLKQKYIDSKTANDKENERFLTEQLEIKGLRKRKVELQKKKELSEKECQKFSNELQQCIQDRQELEGLAQKLSLQLESVQDEKGSLYKELQENQQAIDECNIEFKSLKGELENMKHVIQNTFEEELKSGNQIIQAQFNSQNKTSSNLSQAQQK